MFKRMVVYLYYYENGEKKKNCGYAKMTMHQGECRVELNMIDVPELEGDIRVCFCQEKEGKIIPVEAVRGTVTDGDVCLRYQCECGALADQMSIEDLKWILVDNGVSRERVVCGDVRQEEMDFGRLTEMSAEHGQQEDRVHSAETQADGGTDSVQGEELKISDTEPESEPKEPAVKEESELAAQEESEPAAQEKPELVSQEEPELVSQEEPEPVSQEKQGQRAEEDETSVYEYDEECLRNKTECQQGGSGKWLDTASWQEKLFHNFPKVLLHINGEETVGIKLRPQDMVWFPNEYWRMATNKFLLNSYYNYRYILFFKGTGKQKGKYYLGMPGYMEKQAGAAARFGFPEFFNTEQQRSGLALQEQREKFGFWCRET